MAAIWRYEIFFREMRRFNISPAAGLAPIVSKLNYFCWSTQWGNQLVPAMQSSRRSAAVVLIPSQPSTGTCGADSQTTGFLYQLTNCKIMRVNTAGARLAGAGVGWTLYFQFSWPTISPAPTVNREVGKNVCFAANSFKRHAFPRFCREFILIPGWRITKLIEFVKSKSVRFQTWFVFKCFDEKKASFAHSTSFKVWKIFYFEN